MGLIVDDKELARLYERRPAITCKVNQVIQESLGLKKEMPRANPLAYLPCNNYEDASALTEASSFYLFEAF